MYQRFALQRLLECGGFGKLRTGEGLNIRSPDHLPDPESTRSVFGSPRYLGTYGLAIFTSIGFTDAALTLISSSSGFVIFGTGSVARLYSEGLQNFVRAMARIMGGILDMVLIGIRCCL